MTVVKVLNRFIIHIDKMFCIYISVGNFPECVVLDKGLTGFILRHRVKSGNFDFHSIKFENGSAYNF